MRRVLVTGATGFLGGHLTKELLRRGMEVTALVKEIEPGSIFEEEKLEKQVTVVNGRLEDLGILEDAIKGVDTVFHLAAQAIVEEGVRDPIGTFESNIRGTYNLLEVCRHSKTVQRIVAASSDKAYGTCSDLPYTEDMPLHGDHPYDVSKSCMDLLCQAYWKTYELPISVIRSGNMYGPGDVHWSRLIPGTIRSILHGEPPEIRSDGTLTRDYLFVEDVVDGYLRAADAMSGQVFNLGPNKPLSVLEVVQTILALMGKEKLGYRILNRATNEIPHQYLSAEKAKKILGWAPRHTIEEGLRKTIPWYERVIRKTK